MRTPKTTLAFDVYGTLIDTAGVVAALQKLLGARAAAVAFSDQWRAKQLEYTFRYAAMGRYRDFRVCTRQALDYCCAAPPADFDAATRDRLMAQYLHLPAFDDVLAGLNRMAESGMKMYAFSNGRADDLQLLLTHAGLRAYFAAVVSVDEVSSFKPDPAVYRRFLKRAHATAEQSWLISSNPFDICGARAIGMRAVWLRRNPAVAFDPWEFSATHEVNNFTAMADIFTA